MRSALIALLLVLLGGCATTTETVVTRGDGPSASADGISPPAQLTLPAKPSLASELVIKALSLIGVPYRYGGNSPQTGFDCSGLVRHVFGQVAGVALPYDAHGMSELGQQVGVRELQPGDLVFFNTLRRPFSHVGIYVGERRFVHAPTTGGAVEVVDMAHRYWHQRFDGARRLPLQRVLY